MAKCPLLTMLWIRIRLDRHPFDGSGSISISCKAYVAFFPGIVNVLFKILIIMTHMTLTERQNTGNAVNKCQKNFWFSNICKTWGRIRNRIRVSASKWKADPDRHQILKRCRSTTLPSYLPGNCLIALGHGHQMPQHSLCLHQTKPRQQKKQIFNNKAEKLWRVEDILENIEIKIGMV